MLRFFNIRLLSQLLVAILLIANPLRLIAEDKDLYLNYQKRVSEIFTSKKEAVVRIFAERDPAADSDKMQNIGTGFFISRDGLVMTVVEILEHARSFTVESHGNVYEAALVGFDPLTRIAIFKAYVPTKIHQFIHLSEHLDIPDVSTLLLGITCKLGLDPGPAVGMVTGLHTDFMGTIFPSTFLRSDIPYDQGEGGAPVFDLQGRFVGMMVYSLEGIRSSFIVPARAILRIRDDLLFSGHASYGFLGLELDRDASMPIKAKVVVGKVVENAPAAQAGILPKDQILEFNNMEIKYISDLHNALFFARPGQYHSMKVLREDQIQEIVIKIAEQPQNELKNIFFPQVIEETEGPQEAPVIANTQTQSQTAVLALPVDPKAALQQSKAPAKQEIAMTESKNPIAKAMSLINQFKNGTNSNKKQESKPTSESADAAKSKSHWKDYFKSL